MSERDRDRLNELLADRAVQGLGDEELRELQELMKQYPDWDESQMDVAVAALNLADLKVDEPLPEALRERIIADAYSYFDAIHGQAGQTANQRQARDGRLPEDAESKKLEPVGDNVVRFPQVAMPSKTWQMAGWYAAAACLLLAILGWYPRLMQTETPTPPTLAELRERLLREAPDLVRTSWSPASYEPGKGVGGDVVWSNARQEGFMRFQGIPAVDPSVSEYQLWIFDASRDERYPVDGGVFAVNEQTGEVIVRIDAKIKVSEPKLFAITVEPPGGVVVSKRDKLMLVAQVK